MCKEDMASNITDSLLRSFIIILLLEGFSHQLTLMVFTGVLVAASLLKSPGLFSVY